MNFIDFLESKHIDDLEICRRGDISLYGIEYRGLNIGTIYYVHR